MCLCIPEEMAELAMLVLGLAVSWKIGSFLAAVVDFWQQRRASLVE